MHLRFFFLEQDHMGLNMAKCYSYSFRPISVNLYRDIDNHTRTHDIVFSW